MFIVFCLCSIDTLARVVTNALAWGVIVPLARALSPVFVSRFRWIKQAHSLDSQYRTHVDISVVLTVVAHVAVEHIHMKSAGRRIGVVLRGGPVPIPL